MVENSNIFCSVEMNLGYVHLFIRVQQIFSPKSANFTQRLAIQMSEEDTEKSIQREVNTKNTQRFKEI